MALLNKAEAMCPHHKEHTQCPSGYIEWHDWAEEMAKTHEQIICGGCGLYAIWVPKRKRP